MTEKSFSGAMVLCPNCKRRTFYQDQPWKRVCVPCYLEQKGRTVSPAPASAAPIRPDMLKRLIYLVHPDKHLGSEASHIATTYLLNLRNDQRKTP